MSDNPFAEPDDNDGTVIVPRAASQYIAAGPDPTEDFSPLGPDSLASLSSVGRHPTIGPAASLLSLLSGLRNLSTVPDPGRLRERTVNEVRRYEQLLRNARLPLETIRTSHYALCASIDDVVQNTPWGSRGAWANASLVATFHQEARSGDRFFDLLGRLCQTPGKFLPVIELMYLCMSLGMQGRYRLSQRGPAELDRVREETYLIILRQRGAAEPSLSPHWQGVLAPYRGRRAVLPVWLTVLVCLGAISAAYVLMSLGLNSDSDRTFAAGLALPPATMPTIVRQPPPKPVAPPPQPAAPQPPGVRAQLAGLLQPEIAAGQVSIAGTDQAPIMRIQSAGMFASGSAAIEPRFLPLLSRVADVLRSRPGPIRVVGYTDKQPIHTVAFPSNFQLSLARAQSAATVLGKTLGSTRLTAEGRADADPIDTEATPEGRQKNRRIEIVTVQEQSP